MDSVEEAKQNHLRNIETRSGKTLAELYALIRAGGLTRHNEIRDHLKRELAMSHGDANAVALAFLKAAVQPEALAAPGSEAAGSPAAGSAPADVVSELYAGPKAGLRPIHERLMAAIGDLGPFEVAPRKGYVSLRRKKQFAMIGPATRTRVEVGLNMKGIPPTSRLIELPPGGMCQYQVNLSEESQVDGELLAWIKQAYDGAG